MQHDDDDDNATAREIIKEEIRARKHKGDNRGKRPHRPESSGIPRGRCPQTDSVPFSPCCLLPNVWRAGQRRMMGKVAIWGISSTSDKRDRKSIYVESLLTVADPLVVPIRQPHTQHSCPCL